MVTGSHGSSPAKMPFDHLKEGMTGLEKAIHLIRTKAERAEQAQEETLSTLREALPRQQRAMQHVFKHLHAVILGVVVGLVALSLVLTGVVLWQMPARQTTPNYTPAFLAVDSVLVQHWQGLPKGVQQHLEQAYKAGGVQPPGTRK